MVHGYGKAAQSSARFEAYGIKVHLNQELEPRYGVDEALQLHFAWTLALEAAAGAPTAGP